MALFKLGAEGQTNGTTVSIANSDDFGDDALSTVSIGTGIARYSSAQAAHGTRSIEVSADSGTATLFGYNFGDTDRAVVRVYLRLTALPTTSEGTLIQFRSSSASLNGLNIKDTGILTVRDATNTLRYTASTALNINTWYRIEFAQRISTTVGQTILKVFTLDSTTPVSGIDHTSAANLNTGSTQIGVVRFGKITSGQALAASFWDDMAVESDTISLLGPVVADTVGAGPDQVNLGPRQAFTLTATSSSGSVVWSQVSGEAVTLGGTGALTRTGLAPVKFTAGSCVFRATNATVTDDVTISYLPTPVAIKRSGVISPTTIFIKT